MESFKQELTENSYSRQEELVFWDCDRNKKARVAALLSKMAAFAGYDYDARGLTHETLLAAREVFLLSRASIHIHDCPRAADVLTVTTWENGVQGAHMQRVYEMTDQAGRLRVSAKSDWILVDPLTRKILRPNSFKAKTITTCPKEIDCPQPKKLLLPREGREELGVRRVVWSDLDGNDHLFSGNYGDIVWDALPADLREQTPKEFYINYNQEATLGEELRLEGCRKENGYYMEGLGPNGPCFTALCMF
jgi:acyl-ACP thioesterase